MRLIAMTAAAAAVLLMSVAPTVAQQAQSPSTQPATAPAGQPDVIEGEVTEGVLRPYPIAIPAFSGPHGDDIARVVRADLERSGYFEPIDPNAFIQRDLDVAVAPRFDDWRRINAQALVIGADTGDADGRLRSNFRLWDVFGQQQLLGLQYTATPENWRRIAHKIADAIYQKLTGEPGYFDTRVVFVAESGPKTHRIKKLALMDQDGANPQYLTDGSCQVMTPRFSSNSSEVTYMCLGDNWARIYLLNIDTQRQESLGQFNGVVFAPRFSPDGTKVVFSVERGGNVDLMQMNLRTRQTTRLTSDPSIDTSGSYSPDGSRMVFNSDRGGSPQLYVMNADGSGVRRISQGGGRYHTPVWSPRGDWIAFTKSSGGRFSIGVMRPDGSGERLLTSSYFEEGPSWAPNGRYIIFHREAPGVNPRLWYVDLTGRVERQVPYSGSASDPAWSPLLN
ncbi:MAG: Tol-Pal system beta propeller repeat protein TolB [Caulobacteraceae bacterium]|nr:Tol-Pal system beta propeller repeat protein TolB [Caulobacteraceae bacterium]